MQSNLAKEKTQPLLFLIECVELSLGGAIAIVYARQINKN